MSFLSEAELKKIGFKGLGKNVKISDKASIYNPINITIRNNVRIDDFCVLSAGVGGIEIGDHVHIGCYSSLIGRGRIIFEDFSGVGGKVSIYTNDDDYDGNYMCHPTIPDKFKNTRVAEVILKKHSVVATGCVILPGVTIGEGAYIGAMSLVKKDCESFWIYAGVPAKKIRKRQQRILELERAVLKYFSDNEYRYDD
jgi:galactoside O-acetyltransferase